jgi:hypothetical protein
MSVFRINKKKLLIDAVKGFDATDPKTLDGDDYAFRKTELEALNLLIKIIDERKTELNKTLWSLDFQRVGLNKRRIALEASKGAR